MKGFIGRNHLLRIIVGIVLLVIGLVLQKIIFTVGGGAVIALGVAGAIVAVRRHGLVGLHGGISDGDEDEGRPIR